MRIWDLEKEHDRFISFVLEGREKRKRERPGRRRKHQRNPLEEKKKP